MDAMRPAFPSTAKNSGISKRFSSVDELSKPSLPFRNNPISEASWGFVSGLQDFVLNPRWKAWEGFSAVPVSSDSGGAGGVDLLMREAKQAYGAATDAVKRVKRKLFNAFTLNLQKPQGETDTVENAINHVRINSENPSAPTGTVAADTNNANLVRISTLASRHIRESQSSPPSPPLKSDISRNGHAVVHLRSRL